jgi:hypothetical protein
VYSLHKTIVANLSNGVSNRLLLVHLLLLQWRLNLALLDSRLRLLSCLDITTWRATSGSTKASFSVGDAVFVDEVTCSNLKSAFT